MDRKAYNLYQLTKEKEGRLWKEAIFIFDSSSLLDLYTYPEKEREGFFQQIIVKLKDRVWIPSHVQYEFLRNRTSTIKKSFSDHYRPLRDERLKSIGDSFVRTKNLLDDLRQRTSNEKRHPFIKGIDFKALEDELEKAGNAFSTLEESFKAKIQEREKEIIDLETNDVVLNELEKYFPVGKDYPFEAILDIIDEGKTRYKFKIPPGYEDEKEKVGTQIFGDLILWKQILDFAEGAKKSVVFVTNDAKDDWWTIHEKGKGKKEKFPREELIKEFNDRSGREFWMYDLVQFHSNAVEYLKSEITPDQIELISSLFGEYQNNSDTLSYRCSNCKRYDHIGKGDLNLDFELVGGTERNMGEENIYKSTSFFKCNYCDHDIQGVFTIYEYPTGTKNHQSIDLEGADVVRECALNLNFMSEGSENEIEGIEHILYEYLSEESPSELMDLSSRTYIDEVNDVVISSISLEKDGTILVKGKGDVSVDLSYGPSSDESTSSDSFPFEFEASLIKSDDGYELEEMLQLDIDTSSFYE